MSKNDNLNSIKIYFLNLINNFIEKIDLKLEN